MDTINLSRTASGGYLRTINGASPRYCSGIKYDTDSDGIRLVTDLNTKLTQDFMVPAAWTIEGVSGFTTVGEVCKALDVINPNNFNGVCNGTDDVTPHDENPLPDPGYIEVLGVAGNIHFEDLLGREKTRAFGLKECSKFRVRKVFANGTTATGIVSYV